MYDNLSLDKLKEVINDVFKSNKVDKPLPMLHTSPLGHKMFQDALLNEMERMVSSINNNLIFKNPNTKIITEVTLEQWNKLSYETKEKLRDYCISNNLPEYRPGLYQQLDTNNMWKSYTTSGGINVVMQHDPLLDNSYIAGIDPYKINNK